MLFRSRARQGVAIEFRRPFREYFLERLTFRLHHRLERTWNGVPVPRLAAFPTDELGREIAVRGLSERDSLLILFDELLAPYAESLRGQVAVDVGANIGNHTLVFASRFARVLAFEPHPLLARILQVNLEFNGAENVVVLPVALSDRAGDATYLEISERNIGGSGLVETHWSRGQAAGRVLTVSLEPGDEAVSRHCRPEEVGLVKIDVEGHEPHVIKGLERLLTTADPIVLFEVRAGAAEPQGLAAWALLRTFGYGHFYIIQHMPVLIPWAPAPLRWAVNLVDQLVRGIRYRVRPIERFEPCRHEFVIAAKRALL